MKLFFNQALALIFVFVNGVVHAQSTTSTYIGYTLTQSGSSGNAVYDTASTNSSNVSTTNSPDVFLNATVHVGEIDLLVANLSAQVNLAAEVRSLLTFNAGVTASIEKVQLLIQNVSAFV